MFLIFFSHALHGTTFVSNFQKFLCNGCMMQRHALAHAQCHCFLMGLFNLMKNFGQKINWKLPNRCHPGTWIWKRWKMDMLSYGLMELVLHTPFHTYVELVTEWLMTKIFHIHDPSPCHLPVLSNRHKGLRSGHYLPSWLLSHDLCGCAAILNIP